MSPRDTLEGAVVRLMQDKGFGFIRGLDGREYFFHRSDVVDEAYAALEVGTRVTFIPVEAPKGPRAQAVTVAD